MNALRQFVTSVNGSLTIKLPKEYSQKKLEVIVMPATDDLTGNTEQLQSKINSLISNLPSAQPNITDQEIIDEVKMVRKLRHEKKN